MRITSHIFYHSLFFFSLGVWNLITISQFRSLKSLLLLDISSSLWILTSTLLWDTYSSGWIWAPISWVVPCPFYQIETNTSYVGQYHCHLFLSVDLSHQILPFLLDGGWPPGFLYEFHWHSIFLLIKLWLRFDPWITNWYNWDTVKLNYPEGLT